MNGGWSIRFYSWCKNDCPLAHLTYIFRQKCRLGECDENSKKIILLLLLVVLKVVLIDQILLTDILLPVALLIQEPALNLRLLRHIEWKLQGV
jgi:hypothetical protein